jgi:hypothetical protein
MLRLCPDSRASAARTSRVRSGTSRICIAVMQPLYMQSA